MNIFIIIAVLAVVVGIVAVVMWNNIPPTDKTTVNSVAVQVTRSVTTTTKPIAEYQYCGTYFSNFAKMPASILVQCDSAGRFSSGNIPINNIHSVFTVSYPTELGKNTITCEPCNASLKQYSQNDFDLTISNNGHNQTYAVKVVKP